MLLLEILDTLIMKSILWDLKIGLKLNAKISNHKLIDMNSLMDTESSYLLMEDYLILDALQDIPHLSCLPLSLIKYLPKLNFGVIEIMENILTKSINYQKN